MEPSPQPRHQTRPFPTGVWCPCTRCLPAQGGHGVWASSPSGWVGWGAPEEGWSGSAVHRGGRAQKCPHVAGPQQQGSLHGCGQSWSVSGQEGARWGLAGASGGLPSMRALRAFTGARAPRPWRSSGCWVADVLMEMRPKRPGGWPAAVRLEARVLVLRAVLTPQCRASGTLTPTLSLWEKTAGS